jgi:serine-type D-Ala-D-Ala carboxypeptidase (penicillin-binding protein 5/6)
VIDASDGRVLFEDGADRPGYPASMLKLMDLFVIFDRVKAGSLRLDETVPVTKEAYDMGGSQVWLDRARDSPSRNCSMPSWCNPPTTRPWPWPSTSRGSREGFVRLMNEKARELGLSPLTKFQSPHGLPPGPGQRPDMTTPRDFAKLCQALLAAHPETLKYTSVIQRAVPARRAAAGDHGQPQRAAGTVPGCDGLKTGWIRASGYCLAATVQRDGRA